MSTRSDDHRFVQHDEILWIKLKKKSTSTPTKVFCPTGPGGGVDPTCSPKGKGGGGYSPAVKDSDGDIVGGSVGKLSGVDTSKLGKGTKDQFALGVIEKLEKGFSEGDMFGVNQTLDLYEGHPVYHVIEKAAQNLKKLHSEETLEPLDQSAGWKKLEGAKGTEKGGVYELDGKKYYVKQPDDVNRAKNEALAGKLYELAGGGVVKGDLVEIDGKTAFASEWVESQKMSFNGKGPHQLAQQDFALHAWLNNWDAVGAGSENPMDNIRLDKATGKPVLVDAGGALGYSGMGGSGKKKFTDTGEAFDDLRNPAINPTMAKVFGNMTPQQLVESAYKVKAVKDADIDALVDKYGPGSTGDKIEMKAKLKSRRDDIVARAKKLEQKIADDLADDDDWMSLDPDDDDDWTSQAPASTPKPAAAPKPSSSGSKKTTAKSKTFDLDPANAEPSDFVPPKKYFQHKGLDKKAATLDAALQAGDLDAALAVPVTWYGAPGSGSAALHQYQKQVVAAIKHKKGQSGSPSTGSSPSTSTSKPAAPKKAPKPVSSTGKPILIDSSKFPPFPSFTSTNTAQVSANQSTIMDAIEVAKSGDLASLQKMSLDTGIKSPKVKSYISSLMSIVSHQLNPPPPPKSIDLDLTELSAKIKPPNQASPLSKLGHWNVVGSLGGVPKSIPTGQLLDKAGKKELMNLGNDAWGDLPTPQKKAVYAYTGSGYGSINTGLREGKPSKKALEAANGVMKASIPLQEGTLLVRKHATGYGFSPPKVGDVVADRGILSTSASQHGWAGDVKWEITVSKGTKGLPAENFSSSPSEQEVILPPNQRMVVTDVISHNGQTVVRAVSLPTLDNQCCPP